MEGLSLSLMADIKQPTFGCPPFSFLFSEHKLQQQSVAFVLATQNLDARLCGERHPAESGYTDHIVAFRFILTLWLVWAVIWTTADERRCSRAAVPVSIKSRYPGS